MSQPAQIGVFDSGVGGLSVLRAIRQLLSGQNCLYFADQGHVPYGPRPVEEIRQFSEAITRFLLERGAKLVVVACNAASAAALHYLRQVFPDVPFVGMEPAVKPAAEVTQSRVVGVLATPATFQGALYASVVERFADNVILLQDTCPGLVQQIELGNLDGLDTRLILQRALEPMLKRGIDTVVLGCTHYPFVIPMIQEIAGPTVKVIDPAPAVARQVQRLLGQVEGGLHPVNNSASLQFFTSGDPGKLQKLLPRFLGEVGPVDRIVWSENVPSM